MELLEGRFQKLDVLNCDAFEPAEDKLVFAVVSLVKGGVAPFNFLVPGRQDSHEHCEVCVQHEVGFGLKIINFEAGVLLRHEELPNFSLTNA